MTWIDSLAWFDQDPAGWLLVDLHDEPVGAREAQPIVTALELKLLVQQPRPSSRIQIADAWLTVSDRQVEISQKRLVVCEFGPQGDRRRAH